MTAEQTVSDGINVLATAGAVSTQRVIDGFSKLNRITNEVFAGKVDKGRFLSMLDNGWEIRHDEGTAFVSLCHPRGGAVSLLEVKTYGTQFTTGEADELARIVAEMLQERFG